MYQIITIYLNENKLTRAKLMQHGEFMYDIVLIKQCIPMVLRFEDLIGPSNMHQSEDTLFPSESLTDAFHPGISNSNEPFLCKNW